MLELKNINKTYKPKRGQPVHALKNISTVFGDTGLVFILGKSGCGKSTLLNIIGGLDSFDSGEMIIKGKSSKDFSAGDFDSYRNTLVGFIFQEYNILDDFNVEKNIALALELQGKKATQEDVEKILRSVDLEDQAKRKTTELSGGQKQRIAIARALIKNPEIIIADEPTGALDSATGIQVFDTLKELSRDRLVIVVSHDRDFAERYADRIIMMVDGKITSDETKRSIPAKAFGEGIRIVGNDTVHIKQGHRITNDEAKAVLKLIADSGQDIMISTNHENNKEIRKIIKVDEEGNSERFETSDKQDLKLKEYDGNKLKLIKSKLKYKDSLKMGASGLKAKPIRLFFTILLCFIAFAMFGLTDTLGTYNKRVLTSKSIFDSKVNNLSFTRGEKSDYGSVTELKLKLSDIEKLEELTGSEFIPVYSGPGYNTGISLYNNFENTNLLGSQWDSFYRQNLSGFAHMTRQQVESLGFKIVGSGWAKNPGEIVLTKYIYSHFKVAGYIDPEDRTNSLKPEDIISESTLLNKKIKLDDKVYTIKAFVDTELDEGRFAALKQSGQREDMANTMATYLLIQEFGSVVDYGYHAIGIVSDSDFEGMIERDVSKSISIGNMGFINMESAINSMYYSYGYLASARDLTYKAFVGEKSSVEEGQFMMDAMRVMQLIESLDSSNPDYQGIIDIYYGVLSSINYYISALADDAPELVAYFASGEGSSKIEYNYYLGNSNGGYYKNGFGGSSGIDIKAKYINDHLFTNAGYVNLLIEYITDSFNYSIGGFAKYFNNSGASGDVELAGLFALTGDLVVYNNNGYYSEEIVVVDDALFDYVEGELENEGVYNFAIAKMPDNLSDITKLVNLHYDQLEYGDQKTVYSMVNEVVLIMNSVSSIIETLSSVFLYIGIGFAVFASLMMTNFIATSISYKKRDIGILRAVGARSKDVFGIFFNESLIIALINFVLATATTIGVTTLLNKVLRDDYGLKLTLLNFGIRQVALILAVSVLVALVASAIPVFRVARKKPIDAINNR